MPAPHSVPRQGNGERCLLHTAMRSFNCTIERTGYGRTRSSRILKSLPIHLSTSGRRGTQSGQAGETCYKLARALSISDHQIRRQ